MQSQFLKHALTRQVQSREFKRQIERKKKKGKPIGTIGGNSETPALGNSGKSRLIRF